MKKEITKNDIRSLMKSIHGLVDLSKLKPTNIKNIYYTNGVELFEQYAFFNGFDYIALNPMLLVAYNIELENDDNKDEIKKLIPQVSGEKMCRAIEEHKNRIKILVDKKEWVRAFKCIEKKLGLTIFVTHFDNIPDDQKYDSFIAIYTRSEFGFEILKDIYKKVFEFSHLSKKREKRINLLKKKFKEKKFTIYHGASIDYPVYDYYSWTLQEKVAEFFAYRYSGRGQVLSERITHHDAIDYISSRNEAEILFSPSIEFLTKNLIGFNN